MCLNAKGGMGRIDAESETFITHALRAEGFDASEDGTGRGTPLVPVPFDTTQITSKANYSSPQPGDPCHPLAAGAHPPAIAFSAKDHGADAGEIAPTLRSMSSRDSNQNGGGQVAAVLYNMAVRRLTPVECERLQGFPDNYTNVPFRGKSAADGPRYKALGNSMAVPVMAWIGKRIQMVEAIAQDGRERGC
jgi:DNA (cytosine-5)-methyltransferase 1